MALNRETIVRTALRVLDEVGLDALTLRRIAAELGVRPPALYWHFKNKQDLVDEMAGTLLADAPPPPTGLGWQDFLLVHGTGLRAMLLRHRDGARMFSGTYLTDTGLCRKQDTALRLLTDAGFSPADAAAALFTVYCYTVGFAIEEQAVHLRPGERDPRDAPARRAERMAEDVPPAREAGAEMFHDHGPRFDRGLRAIVAGVGAWLT